LALNKNKISCKPRLLIILNRFVIGGQAADTLSLAWHLKNDFEILVLTGEKEKDETEPEFLLQKYPGVVLKKNKYLRRGINPFIDLLAFFHALIAIIRYKPHIVHTHGAKPGFAGRVAAWIAGVPVIVHTFHGHIFHSYFSKLISGFIASVERIVGKITTCAIALSESQKNELVNQYHILPALKIVIIQLGFDFEDDKDPATLRQNFRNKYNLQQDDIAIGIVGRIVPIKNHSFFVKVIHRILTSGDKNPPAFFIIGDGDLRSNVEKELHQKKIAFSNKSISRATRVVFTSWLTDIIEVMNGLDIVVLTSLNEGTPLSVIEAQYFKKPIVATNVGGLKDSMRPGITGFIVEKNDLITFCEKLDLLIVDEHLRNTMGKDGNQFVSVQFSKQKEITLTRDLYFYLLRKKGIF
jgi:glycosyltransferase involved in cell wall biosynthesis